MIKEQSVIGKHEQICKSMVGFDFADLSLSSFVSVSELIKK
jgi:hypothetical protein